MQQCCSRHALDQRPLRLGCARQVLLAEVMNSLEDMVDVLRQHGFEPLKEQYVGSWLHTDQEV